MSRFQMKNKKSPAFRGAAFLFACLGVAAALPVAAEIRLPKIFSDHAVLQQNARIPIWGWGAPDELVTVMLGEEVQLTIAGRDGRWIVDMPEMAAGGPYELSVQSLADRIVLEDILVGEVWLASGQSNMQWSIKRTDNWEAELARSENDNIRFAMVHREVSAKPLDDLRALTSWERCNAETLANCYDGAGFSAVSYYFAKHLQAELGVPVGIINTSWGGTRIEPWTPPVGFAQVPALSEISESLSSADEVNRQTPTALYNAMVAPIVPYANRGFIWYQGESNRGEGMLYRDKMEALIKGWRSVWKDDDLACYFVQLAPFDYGNNPEALPEMWEAQTASLEIPGTGMAVINDIGNVKNIHPTNKDDVGKRLAWLALSGTYARMNVVSQSPLFDRLEVEGSEAHVFFKHARSLKTRDGEAPNWFAISGADGEFHEAKASIDGAKVVLTAEGVGKPTAVRFAWDHTAEPNLTNEAGLPASAFRAGWDATR